MTFAFDHFGIYRPSIPIVHKNNEYQDTNFKTLLEMQDRHFWYIGRHKFLLQCLKKHLKKSHKNLIDLGGGVGGWIKYLINELPIDFKEIALGDSSNIALIEAKKILPSYVNFYQIDLMVNHWQEKWDVIFLLDVIEHLPDNQAVLSRIFEALKPNGILIVSAPALKYFWSYNDDFSKHLRRYNISDFMRLAGLTGLNLIDSRYFMFFLSPLYWLSRKFKPKTLSQDEIDNFMKKTHQVPNYFINFILAKIFSAETPLGHFIKFPWGTSIIGVFQKP